MSVSINQNGVWIDIEQVHINENGTWVEVQNQYVNNLSTWRKVIPDVGGIWVSGYRANVLAVDWERYEVLWKTQVPESSPATTYSEYTDPRVYVTTPVIIFAGGSNWKEISTSSNMVSLIDTDGYLWTAGWIGGTYSPFGQLPYLGRIPGVSLDVSPVRVGEQQNDWKLPVTEDDGTFSSGFYHTAAIKTDGTLWLWGTNAFSALGNAETPIQTDYYLSGNFVDNAISDGKIADTPVTTFAGGTDWKQVSCGRYATAAIKTDGTLWIWGRGTTQPGYSSLLGNNNAIANYTSTPITTFAGGTDWKQVSVGKNIVAAVKTDGTLWTWGGITGSSLLGSLANFVRTPVTTFAGGTDWKSVVVGDQDGVAAIKTDGTLWTWGNTYVVKYTNIQANNKPEDLYTMTSWTTPRYSGSDSRTNLEYHSHRRTPVTTFVGGNNWMAFNSDGIPAISVYENVDDSSTNYIDYIDGTNTQTIVNSLTEQTANIAAIKTDGTLWVWGDNRGGQCGVNFAYFYHSYIQANGAAMIYVTPVTTFAGGTDWKQVSCGNNYMMAIKTNGTLWTWGVESNYRMSRGNTPNGYPWWFTPVQVLPVATDWKQVSCGKQNTAAIKTDGTLWTWGADSAGQTGQAGGVSLSYKTPSTTFAGGTNWKQVSVSEYNMAAIKTDGTLWVWGNYFWGHIGTFYPNTLIQRNRSTPTTTQVGGTDWKQVVCKNTHVEAIKTDGTLWTWGYPSPVYNSQTPAPVAGSGWSLTAGNSVIKTDGTLWANGKYTWLTGGTAHTVFDYSSYTDPQGISSYTTWELAYNYIAYSHPITIFGGGSNWSVIAADSPSYGRPERLQAAVKTDGTLWTWGDNFFGQLGIQKSAPQQYSFYSDPDSPTNYHTAFPNTTFIGGTNWKQVSVGSHHMGAIKTDGTLWLWGGRYDFNPIVNEGLAGQYLSYPLTASISVQNSKRHYNLYPSQVFGGGTDWKQVSCGRYATIGIKTDGTFWSWGDSRFNTQGGNSVDFLVPTVYTSINPWRYAGTNYPNTNNSAATIPTQRYNETDWNTVSVNSRYGTGLKTDGTLWLWGTSRIESDNNTSVRVSVPVYRRGVKFESSLSLHKLPGTWKTSSVTDQGGAAIKTDGTLWMWGNNTGSRLGNYQDGATGSTTPVTTFAGGTDWKQVDTNELTTAAIKTDGTLWTWGRNSFGQLGVNDTIERNTPVTTFAGGTDWKKVFCGESSISAIKTDGTLWTWGRNTFGELGLIDPAFNEFDTNNRYTPVTTFLGGNNWKKISMDKNYFDGGTFGLKTDGTIWTWGNTLLRGVSDYASFPRIETPVTVFSGQNNWASAPTPEPEDLGQFVAGDNHTAAIRTDGTLWTWGDNSGEGILGNNQLLSRSNTPITTSSGGNNWKQISVARHNKLSPTMGLKTDGTIWLWGNNGEGQLGFIDSSDLGYILTPRSLFVGGNNWKQIDTNSSLFGGIKTDGTLWLWGYEGTTALSRSLAGTSLSVSQRMSGYYIAGENFNAVSWNSTPTKLPYGPPYWKVPDPGLEYTVAVSNYGVAAIKNDGTLWTWGTQALGNQTVVNYPVLGNGSTGPLNRAQPGETDRGGTDWKSVAAAERSIYAIKTDGTLWSWGSNYDGELGNASYTTFNYTPSPVYPSYVTNWKQVSAGGYSVAAIKTDGTLWVWGNNYNHQLGIRLSIYAERNTPVTTYYTNSLWTQVSMGAQHCLALRNVDSSRPGALLVWGNNTIGELFYGSGSLSAYSYSSVPYWTTGPSDWIQVSAGHRYSAGIRANGTLWMWGNNSSGKLGINNILPRSSPVTTFAGGTDWKKVRCGFKATAAIKTDGTLWLWGNGYYLGLPNGDYTDRQTPIQISIGGNDWEDVQWWTGSQSSNDFNQYGHVGFAIKTNGDMYSWSGSNPASSTNGLLLVGINKLDRRTPHEIRGGGTDWKQLSLAESCGAAIKTDGTLWVWGQVYQGNLGNNQIAGGFTTPVTTFAGGTDWKQVSVSNDNMAAIKTDGTLWTWGLSTVSGLPTIDKCGQNNTGPFTYIRTPGEIFGGGTDWKQVSVGHGCMSAVKTDGTLWVWGWLGDNNLENVALQTMTPVTTFLGGNNWKQVSCGKSHILALSDDGVDKKLYTFGVDDDDYFIFGTNQLRNRVGILEGPWKDVVSGSTSSSNRTAMALSISGELYIWGNSLNGLPYSQTPVPYLPLQSNKWKSITGDVYFWAGIQSYF